MADIPQENYSPEWADDTRVAPPPAFAVWEAECRRAREIVAGTPSLEATGLRKRTGERFSLRWALVHMIAEYARHNGHADLLRERIDGATGF